MSRFSTFFHLCIRLAKDEHGTILIQFTVYAIAIFAVIGLALDGGRYFLLHNDLQDLADAAALAAAAKLDGTKNSLSNAAGAARSLNINDPSLKTPHWWDIAGVAILPGTQGVQFFETLADVDVNNQTTDPRLAHYVRVNTGTWWTKPTFLALVGASKNPTTASALAEATTEDCKPQVMMLCNPNEPNDGTSTGDTSNFNPTPGQMFVFSTTGATNGYSPGVFSLLDTPDGQSSDAAIEAFLSQQSPSTCISEGISPAQGQKTSATKIGINVRFDQKSGNVSGVDESPAPIKIDGFSPVGNGNNCNKPGDVSASSYPLPQDVTYVSQGNGSVHVGTGINDLSLLPELNKYWQNHHGADWPRNSDGSLKTRYQTYQDEINGIGRANTWLTDRTEPHEPQCNAINNSEYNYTRRLLSVAVVDCAYWNVQGNKVNNIEINTYADFFITKPTDQSGNIYTEFVATHQTNDSTGGLKRIVRLVR